MFKAPWLAQKSWTANQNDQKSLTANQNAQKVEQPIRMLKKLDSQSEFSKTSEAFIYVKNGFIQSDSCSLFLNIQKCTLTVRFWRENS